MAAESNEAGDEGGHLSAAGQQSEELDADRIEQWQCGQHRCWVIGVNGNDEGLEMVEQTVDVFAVVRGVRDRGVHDPPFAEQLGLLRNEKANNALSFACFQLVGNHLHLALSNPPELDCAARSSVALDDGRLA